MDRTSWLVFARNQLTGDVCWREGVEGVRVGRNLVARLGDKSVNGRRLLVRRRWPGAGRPKLRGSFGRERVKVGVRWQGAGGLKLGGSV